MGLFGPPNIVKLKAKGNIKGLIRALKKSKVRSEAEKALGEIGLRDVQVVEPLIEALKDEESYVRRAAASILGKISDTRPVEPLIETIKDKYIEVRMSSIRALGQIGDERAIKPLIKTLKDKSNEVHNVSTKALVKIGKPSVDAIIDLIEDQDSKIRKSAIRMLGQIRDKRAIQPLITALNDNQFDICKEAAKSLKVIESPVDRVINVYFAIVECNWDNPILMDRVAVVPLLYPLK